MKTGLSEMLLRCIFAVLFDFIIPNSLNLNRDVLTMISINKQVVRKVVGISKVNRKVHPIFIAVADVPEKVVSLRFCSFQ